MGRQTLWTQPSQGIDRKKTKQELREAMREVRAAVGKPRKSLLREGLSWAVALTAGAAFLRRSLQVAEIASTTEIAPTTPDASESQRAVSTPSPSSATVTPPAQSGTATRETTPSPSPETRPQDATAPSSEKVEGGLLALCKELTTRFTNDECPMRAQALAFTGILSLVPLMLVALAALGFFIHDPRQAADYVQRFVAQMLPGRQATQAASEVIQQTHILDSAKTLMNAKWWAAIGGLLSLLLTALGLFVSATEPMNAAWDVKETRSFLKLRWDCLKTLIGAGLLFALSLALSSGPDTIRRLHLPWLGLPSPVPFWIDALFELLAVALNIGMFILIYRSLPNAPVTWRAAAFGGVIAGVLWELFKKGFALYLAYFGDFNKLYGALGGVVLLITWIWYSCIVLLAGAILCKMYHEHREEGGVVRKVRL